MFNRRMWRAILEHAAAILESYETGVTLRQLFYRLVADETLENTRTAYSQLSDQTVRVRPAGTFPDLLDRGREIHRAASWTSPAEAREWLADVYRRDRTEGQYWSVYLGVEKAGLVAQLEAWFGALGVPVLALGGYTSQSFVSGVQRDTAREARPAVLLYAGDFDPSGEDIDRDFVARSDCWARVERVALSAEQVAAYQLPPAMGKATDSRAAGFVKRHGALVQVELDALPPDTLRALYAEAVARYWNGPAYQAAFEQERAASRHCAVRRGGNHGNRRSARGVSRSRGSAGGWLRVPADGTVGVDADAPARPGRVDRERHR